VLRSTRPALPSWSIVPKELTFVTRISEEAISWYINGVVLSLGSSRFPAKLLTVSRHESLISCFEVGYALFRACITRLDILPNSIIVKVLVQNSADFHAFWSVQLDISRTQILRVFVGDNLVLLT